MGIIEHLEAIGGCEAASPPSFSIKKLFWDVRMLWWIFSKLGQEVVPVALC